MIRSELALELDIEPSVLSKDLKKYERTMGKEVGRHLDDEAISHIRQARQFMRDRRAATFEHALGLVLGTHRDPLPSETVVQLFYRLEQLEKDQAETLATVQKILSYMDETRARRAERQMSVSQQTAE